MWYLRQSNNLLLFCTLILCAGFMLQFKVLYNNHQKQLRVHDIEKRMTELGDTILSIERVANTTQILFNKLEKSVKHKGKFKR